MCPLSLSLSLLLLSSSFPVHAAVLTGEDGHPHGYLGKTWEIAVAVALGFLIFGAAATIIIVTIRQRRHRFKQSEHPDFAYASHPPPVLSPSMPYGISKPNSVYQPWDKHGRRGSLDRSSRLKESA